MKSYLYWILGLVVVVVLAAGTVYYLNNRRADNKSGDQRQAVFLTNGQVYFGFVQDPMAEVIKIKDIYYLRTQDLLQANESTDESKKISLVKLGNELHGPTDEMLINRNQILFIESMRNDSKINSAINSFSGSKSTGQKLN